MKITVIVNSNDSETQWNAFRFATTCLIYENEVTVFLLGKGVEATAVSSLKFDVKAQMELFREHGGILIGCRVCCENRRDTMPLLEESLDCSLGSMQELYALAIGADKVVSF